MLYALLKTLHVLAIVAWVGGMFFMMLALRPAAQTLPDAQRLTLLRDALGRFFRVVDVAAVLTLGTGIWMIGNVAKATVQAGGDFTMPLHWHVMTVLGLVMGAVYLWIRLKPWKALDRAVQSVQWAPAGEAFARIRTLVHVNAGLGLVVIVSAVWGGAA